MCYGDDRVSRMGKNIRLATRVVSRDVVTNPVPPCDVRVISTTDIAPDGAWAGT